MAYFAKGPLSRARASLRTDESAPSAGTDLMSFLQSCILGASRMDKKYRDSLPNIVQSLLPVDITDGEASTTAVQEGTKKKKRRSGKLGPGKDGLHSQEEDCVTRWWRAGGDDQTATMVRETGGDPNKGRFAALRSRETKLQIILILEVLAQQVLSADGSSTRNDLLDESQGGGTSNGRPNGSRRRKGIDLNLTLELLLDRLCIWQSLHTDGLGSSMPSMDTRNPGNTVKTPGIVGSVTMTDSDDLRNFCTEVIVPLYVKVHFSWTRERRLTLLPATELVFLNYVPPSAASSQVPVCRRLCDLLCQTVLPVAGPRGDRENPRNGSRRRDRIEGLSEC